MRDVPQLKLVREGQGWSQRDLAARSGVAQNTISQLERGERQAMPSTVRKLADALGVDPPTLMAQASRTLGDLPEEQPSTVISASRRREASQRQETRPLPEAAIWKHAEEERRNEEERNWAEHYVSREFVEISGSFSAVEKDRWLSREREWYLNNMIPALVSCNEDLFVARSRLASNDPKQAIEAAQLVLSRAWKIMEEYDSKLQSFHRIPEHYYADPAAHSQIRKLQAAYSEQGEAAADAVRELMNLYDESLDTLENQVIAMREEGEILEKVVTQTRNWER